MIRALLFLFLLSCSLVNTASIRVHLQHESPASDSLKKPGKGKIHFRPVPVIATAPETGIRVGVGALSSFPLYTDSATHYSLISPFVCYTQDKQDYLFIPYELYSKDNNYYFEGEVDYYNFSYYYWGVGTNRVAKELYDVRFPKIFCNAYKKLVPHVYAGIDYYFEDDKIMNLNPAGQLATGEITGAGGSVNSGLGVCAYYDTRDSVYYPTRGWYIKATSYFNSNLVGASFNYTKITADICSYRQIARPVVLAFDEHTVITSGTVPFNQMALVGGPYDMRGYYMGYYRDNDFTMLQAEARIHLFWRIGFDAFAGFGYFGNANVFPESPGAIHAEGVGLRYNYDKRQHVNVRLDVGYGQSAEIYLEVLEAF
ncbi:MAG: BamA/TamA family outer membrane protein [Bacteroidia bacterium]|nr:BamA/TamA family outer membrane protein [Bacteroidia bacterium]